MAKVAAAALLHASLALAAWDAQAPNVLTSVSCEYTDAVTHKHWDLTSMQKDTMTGWIVPAAKGDKTFYTNFVRGHSARRCQRVVPCSRALDCGTARLPCAGGRGAPPTPAVAFAESQPHTLAGSLGTVCPSGPSLSALAFHPCPSFLAAV